MPGQCIFIKEYFMYIHNYIKIIISIYKYHLVRSGGIEVLRGKVRKSYGEDVNTGKL